MTTLTALRAAIAHYTALVHNHMGWGSGFGASDYAAPMRQAEAEIAKAIEALEVTTGFDEVDLDMIRRGDMLGPRLGQRVYDALASPAHVPEGTAEMEHEASYRIGAWLSAALDDPGVCAETKADINAWFAASQPLPTMLSKVVAAIERHQYTFERVPAAWNAFVNLRREIVAMLSAAPTPKEPK